MELNGPNPEPPWCAEAASDRGESPTPNPESRLRTGLLFVVRSQPVLRYNDGMLYYLVVTLYVLVCLFLLVVVLLQQGRAGDIAAAFGGSSSQTAFGARSGATVLTRATAVLAVLFMAGSLALAIFWQQGSGAAGSGIRLPAGQSAPAPPPPAAPAPAKK